MSTTIDPKVWQEAIVILRMNLRTREGYSLTKYKDGRGNDTIGIGHLMLPDDKPIKTDAEVMQDFSDDISIAIQDFNTLFHGVKIDNPVRLAAIVEWLFIMGLPNARDFVDTIGYIKKHDWLHAAVNMLHSKWFEDPQTDDRAFLIADALCMGR
jgi:GH24 family phage-related lysozyme (muramidase)